MYQSAEYQGTDTSETERSVLGGSLGRGGRGDVFSLFQVNLTYKLLTSCQLTGKMRLFPDNKAARDL